MSLPAQAPFPASSRRVRLDRRTLSLALLIALILALLLVSALVGAPGAPLPFDLDSTHPTGLRGLRLWLEEMGYPVQRNDGLTFQIPEQASLFFVYPNQLTYTEAEAAQLRQWVADGHTLVLVGPDATDAALEKAFGVGAQAAEPMQVQQEQAQPLLPDGPAASTADVGQAAALDLHGAGAAVPVLRTSSDTPVAAVQQVERGWVWHLAPGTAFSNGGLANGGQGSLLVAILRTVPSRGRAVFDTFHQFGVSRAGDTISTLQEWLYRTPTGWATGFALLTLGLFLVLQGRRLGPALPGGREVRRREAAEFVHAMANLTRRAHRTDDVALHQRERLKRGLAQRRAVSADLPDDQFLARLAETAPPLSAEQQAHIAAVLRGLSACGDERTLVKLAAQVDDLLDQNQARHSISRHM